MDDNADSRTRPLGSLPPEGARPAPEGYRANTANEEVQGMRCPLDGTQLTMSDRQGVEIDYCPQCRGVWLDRGELDKIVERAASVMPVSERPEDYPSREAYDRRDDYDRGEGQGHHGSRGHGDKRYGRKRRSFLDDIFDFG